MLHYRHLKLQDLLPNILLTYQCPKCDYQGKCGLQANSYIPSTDMHRLTMGIRSEKCVIRTFHRCVVREGTYTNLHITAYNTPSLYIAYCS